jgi:hypothetical protein
MARHSFFFVGAIYIVPFRLNRRAQSLHIVPGSASRVPAGRFAACRVELQFDLLCPPQGERRKRITPETNPLRKACTFAFAQPVLFPRAVGRGLEQAEVSSL